MNIGVHLYRESEEITVPKYETSGAAGMDVCAKMDVMLLPGETKLVPTGLFVQIPDGYEIQVRPRSGVSLKTGLRVANAPGTIDSDYRGEICVIMQNTYYSQETQIRKGDKIAQIVLKEVPQISWIELSTKEEFTVTVRGEGGFGSTGK
jgi:dUTP pyrophosphatase